VAAVKGEDEKKDRQKYEKMDQVRQGVYGNQDRRFEIGAPDEITVIREEVPGRPKGIAEPGPREKPTENKTGIVFDV